MLEFSSGGQDVDEPETVAEPLAIRVNRMGGSMQIVAVQWTAVNDQGISLLPVMFVGCFCIEDVCYFIYGCATHSTDEMSYLSQVFFLTCLCL